MHVLLQVLLIGVASNLDNLAVGVAYGIRRISVPTLPNLTIAAIAFAFSAISAVAGAELGHYLPPRLADVLGALIIIGIGVWMLPLRGRAPVAAPPPASRRPSVMTILREPELADRDHSHEISLSESLLLGVALSINCLTNGVPAGLWKLNAWHVATCNAVMSFATLWFGVQFGKRYGAHWLGRKADAISGGLLILLGLHQAVCG